MEKDSTNNTAKDLALVEEQVSSAMMAANATKITDSETMLAAGELFSKIKQVGKLMKQKKEAITKPLNEGLKNVRAMFAPFESQQEAAETILTDKMDVYTKEVRKEADRIEREAAEELQKIEAAKESGKITEAQAEVKEEKVERQLEKAPEVIKNSPNFHTREEKKFCVVDKTLLPFEYLKADEVLIRKAMYDGVVLQGVEYYTETNYV